MKMSFSLSSLQLSSNSLERQRRTGTQAERPYNSLTKKRKDPKQTYCQRMWTNREDCKDDFWAAIRSNYDYIMDTNLIDSCKEANGELIWDEDDVSTQSWNLKEVSCQFSELYSWLRVLQELVYSKEENLLDKSLRAAHMEELRRKTYRRKLFNEQAEKLLLRVPALKDEVAWRVEHLNAKWDLVEQIMAPIDRPVSDQQDVTADFEHEIKCLRKWLREMESHLQPLSFNIDWTLAELEEKAMEHMVLQRDIEAHGRIVSSVVKLSERVSAVQQQREKEQRVEERPQRSPQALRIAKSLERRWHLLFLRALEWQCHIETLASRISSKSVVPYRCSSDDSDEEPVTKQPRLIAGRGQSPSRSAACSPSSSSSSPSSCCSSSSERPDRPERTEQRPKRLRATRSPRTRFPEDTAAASRTDPSDSDASSENRSVGDGSYFEDELPQLCVMDTRCMELENDKNISSLIARRVGAKGEESEIEIEIEEAGVGEAERDDMPPTPDTVPVTTSAAINDTCDEIDAARTQTESTEQSASSLLLDALKRRKPGEETAPFNSSDRKSKNCATFYFKHLDTDSDTDCCPPNEDCPNLVDDSSEEEWVYTSPNANPATVEQRKTNVVVRLDFGEAARVDVSQKIRFVQGEAKPRDGEMERINEDADRRGQQRRCETGSEDEANNDKKSIQRLITEVDKLVREERCAAAPRAFASLIFESKGKKKNYRAKYARIKRWLRLNSTDRPVSQSLDSCDASGEYTSEESDGEKETISSDDIQSSVATYRRFEGGLGCVVQSTSQEMFDDVDATLVDDAQQTSDTSTPKVVMRSKARSNGPRPWSVSCISQIGNNSNLNQTNDSISQFSISETALHQLVATPPTKSISLDATGSRKSFNNSTSTLLEESIIRDGRLVRNSSLRRRKSRLRKKNLSRKSESSSEIPNGNHNSAGSDGSSNPPRSARKANANRASNAMTNDSHGRSTPIVKSGSFSGCTEQQLSAEVTAANRLPRCSSTISTSETEGEGQCAVPNTKELRNPHFGIDSDVEMNSLGNTSFSEQAWDNYQEKYMSEPYSEAPDLETARRLLDFGDDYRNFLDSQSDCASSMSAVPATPPTPRKHHDVADTAEDTDSDGERVRSTVEDSETQYEQAEERFSYLNGSLLKDCVEVACACRENLRRLHGLLDSVSGSFRSEKYAKQVRGMIEKWESLSSRIEEAQMASALHRELAGMRAELKAAHDRLLSYDIVLEQPHVLDDRINRITAELSGLRERKAAMLALNVSTHRLITDLGSSASLIITALKDGVADLYRVWDETFQKGNQQLCALQAVQQFGMRLGELQGALQRDKDTLAVLDVALEAGATSEVASSVRHVARLLSEKQDVGCQNDPVANDAPMEEASVAISEKFGDNSVSSSLTQEGGSLSDSGISDSGSEQELSERERRLAVLRRLARNLESQLAPGSDALRDLWKRVDDAETELRELQRQCRELIVRTAASVEARASKRTATQVHHRADKRKKRDSSEVDGAASEIRSIGIDKVGSTDGGDPESEPGLPHSWVWRILRAALPFQLALVALFCAACLLEPHCCEAANTLNLSLTPQLRYVRGPPPV